jgi:hypothetical protein
MGFKLLPIRVGIIVLEPKKIRMFKNGALLGCLSLVFLIEFITFIERDLFAAAATHKFGGGGKCQPRQRVRVAWAFARMVMYQAIEHLHEVFYFGGGKAKRMST